MHSYIQIHLFLAMYFQPWMLTSLSSHGCFFSSTTKVTGGLTSLNVTLVPAFQPGFTLIVKSCEHKEPCITHTVHVDASSLSFCALGPILACACIHTNIYIYIIHKYSIPNILIINTYTDHTNNTHRHR